MDVRNKVIGLLSAAKAQLAKAAPRLGADGSAKAAKTAAPDPSKILFPAGGPSGRDVHSGNLADRLRVSADDISERQYMLRQSAIDLQGASAARDRGERHLTIWGFRFLIGAGWLGLAFWLNQASLQARANDLAHANGIPLDEALVLSNTFLIVGGAGLAAAIMMIALVFISGNASNARLRRRSEIFGDNLAATTREFNKALKFFREKIADKNERPADIIPAVSQAHLTALEAKVFFKDISFLTTIDSDEADGAFRDFLRRFCPPLEGFSRLDLLIVMAAGALIGLGFGYQLFHTSTGVGEPKIYAIMQYPWAWQSLLYGAGAYVLTGMVVEVLSGLFDNREMTKARKDALDSVRSAYTAQEAPLSSEVIRQVEDVVEILRARLGASGGFAPISTANQSPAYAAKARDAAASAHFDDPDLETPPWRRRDSSVKFVETNFQASPAKWRIDAFAKFSERARDANTGPKRGLLSAKKPRRN